MNCPFPSLCNRDCGKSYILELGLDPTTGLDLDLDLGGAYSYGVDIVDDFGC